MFYDCFNVYYRPQMMLRESNVFRSVYLSTGGVCLSSGGLCPGCLCLLRSLSGGSLLVGVSCHTEPPPPVTVEERAVRILLECILVDKVNAHFCNHYISIFLGTRYSSALFSNAAANPTNYTILTRK